VFRYQDRKLYKECIEKMGLFGKKVPKGTKSNVRAFKILFHLSMFSNNMSTGLNTNIIYLICFLLPLPGTDEETEVLYHSNIQMENVVAILNFPSVWKNRNFVEDIPMIINLQFGFSQFISFREEDL
jgi:ascorbate-specific PTS system EIIC-type component UlaA